MILTAAACLLLALALGALAALTWLPREAHCVDCDRLVGVWPDDAVRHSELFRHHVVRR